MLGDQKYKCLITQHFFKLQLILHYKLLKSVDFWELDLETTGSRRAAATSGVGDRS